MPGASPCQFGIQARSPACRRLRGRASDGGYFADIIVERTVLLELKPVEHMLSVHEAQTRTYLRLSGCSVALLMNFNAVLLKDGLRRVIP